MLAPLGAPGFAAAVRAGAEVYGRLRALLRDRGLSIGLGDEDGFAPDLSAPHEVLDLLVHAIETAGYTAGRDGVAVALDPAASEFCADGDDIFVTNPAIIAQALEQGVGNAALIKLNQIGTVTETLEAMRVCRQATRRSCRTDPGRRLTPSSPTLRSPLAAGN